MQSVFDDILKKEKGKPERLRLKTTAKIDASKLTDIEWIRHTLEMPTLVRIDRYGAASSKLSFVFDDKQRAEIKTKHAMNPRIVRDQIFEATGIPINVPKPHVWLDAEGGVATRIYRVAKYHETVSDEELAAEWVRQYVAHCYRFAVERHDETTAAAKAGSALQRVEKLGRGEWGENGCLWIDGRFHLHLPSFTEYLSNK